MTTAAGNLRIRFLQPGIVRCHPSTSGGSIWYLIPRALLSVAVSDPLRQHVPSPRSQARIRHRPSPVEWPGFAIGGWGVGLDSPRPLALAHPRHLSPPQFPAVAPLQDASTSPLEPFAHGGTAGMYLSVPCPRRKKGGGLLGWAGHGAKCKSSGRCPSVGNSPS